MLLVGKKQLLASVVQNTSTYDLAGIAHSFGLVPRGDKQYNSSQTKLSNRLVGVAARARLCGLRVLVPQYQLHRSVNPLV